MARGKDIAIPLADQVVWLDGLEFVKQRADSVAGDSVLDEGDELLGWAWLEVIPGHDWGWIVMVSWRDFCSEKQFLREIVAPIDLRRIF